MDLAAIFTGLDDALATIVGLRHYPFEPANPSPPCAFPLLPESIQLIADFSGNTDLTVQVRVMVPWTDSVASLNSLQEFLATSGASSLREALEGDRTLGGACDDLAVSSIAQTGRVTYGQVDYLAADLAVEILA